jgi:uncharacterized protein (DUF488 family)
MIYTLGHSNRSFYEFLSILKKFKIEIVIDVRRFPSSKKFPWFSKEFLEKELKKNKINYIHLDELGGFRKEGYENFSKSEEFEKGIEKLIEIAKDKNVLIFCSELLWFRCHRRYIARALVEKGIKVIHVFDEKKIQEHKLKDREIEEKMKVRLFCDKKAKKLFKNVIN